MGTYVRLTVTNRGKDATWEKANALMSIQVEAQKHTEDEGLFKGNAGSEHMKRGSPAKNTYRLRWPGGREPSHFCYQSSNKSSKQVCPVTHTLIGINILNMFRFVCYAVLQVLAKMMTEFTTL